MTTHSRTSRTRPMLSGAVAIAIMKLAMVQPCSAEGQDHLTENAWDFTNPDSIPGFASQPDQAPSNPEILD